MFSLVKINKEIVSLIGARLGQALLAIIAIRISTSMLGLSEFGRLGILTATLSFFGLFLVNPLGQYLNRHTHEWFNNGMLWGRLVKYNHLIALISLAAFFITNSWSFTYKNYSLTYSIYFSAMVMLCVYVLTWNSTLLPMLNMLGFRVKSSLLMFLTSLGGLFLSICFVHVSNTALAWQAGVLGGSVCITLYAMFFSRRLLNNRRSITSPQYISRQDFFAYCLPIAASTFLLWAVSNGYRFFISDYYGDEVLGLVVLSFGLAVQFWSVIDTIVTQILYPKFYVRLSTGDILSSVHAFKLLINCIIPAYIIFLGYGCGVASQFLHLLVDEKFWAAPKIVCIAIAVEGVRVLTNVFNQSTQIRKKTQLAIYPYAIAFVGVTMSALFCYNYNLSVDYFVYLLFASLLSALLISIALAVYQFNFTADWILILVSFLLAAFLFLAGSFLQDIKNIYAACAIVCVLGGAAVISVYFVVLNRKHYKELVGFKLPSDEV